MPIFEHDFSSNNFDFRPYTVRPKMLLQRSRRLSKNLKVYFDNINQGLMIKYFQQYINDPWVLRVILKFLTSGAIAPKFFTSKTLNYFLTNRKME